MPLPPLCGVALLGLSLAGAGTRGTAARHPLQVAAVNRSVLPAVPTCCSAPQGQSMQSLRLASAFRWSAWLPGGVQQLRQQSVHFAISWATAPAVTLDASGGTSACVRAYGLLTVLGLESWQQSAFICMCHSHNLDVASVW